MNTKNLEFLQDGLKYLGFDNKLNLELVRHIQSAEPSFTLQAAAKQFKDDMQATLHFRKSDNSDMYFFNKYDAKLSAENGDQKGQTFYINKNAGITFKEAYNLLSGRAVNKDLVNKDGEKYNAWVQLDFSKKDKYDNNSVKQYTANYGYDIAAVLAKHPIREMADNEQKGKLLKSLEKGNVQSVTFIKDGKEERMYLEANPQFKTVNVFDSQMKKVFQQNHAEENTMKLPGEPITKDAKQQKQPVKATKNEGSVLQKKRTRGKSISR